MLQLIYEMVISSC